MLTEFAWRSTSNLTFLGLLMGGRGELSQLEYSISPVAESEYCRGSGSALRSTLDDLRFRGEGDDSIARGSRSEKGGFSSS